MSDFISDNTVDEIAEDMQGSFHTVLHSQSTIPQIAFWVRNVIVGSQPERACAF